MTSPDAGSAAGMELQDKVGDVIRIAFSASTSPVVDLRIRGIRIIGQVLKVRVQHASRMTW